MSEPFVIAASDQRKQYGGVEALRGLNLQVPAGSIFGFLGRNGAGKTTTIKVLLGMAHATSGSALVFGLPPGADAGVSVGRPRHAWTCGGASGSSATRRISTTT